MLEAGIPSLHAASVAAPQPRPCGRGVRGLRCGARGLGVAEPDLRDHGDVQTRCDEGEHRRGPGHGLTGAVAAGRARKASLVAADRPRLAIAVAALGAAVAAEYILGTSLGIDNLLGRGPHVEINTSDPGRLAPETAANFVLLGLALYGMTRPRLVAAPRRPPCLSR